MKRDGDHISFWQDHQYQNENKKPIVNDFDTIIVGAGITGLTLAVELQKRGQKCLILEQQEPGFGTTGGTTAHLNNFFDESYDNIISKFGEDKAQTIADHAKKGKDIVRNNVQQFNIDCDYEECNFYLFSAEKKQDKMVDNILDAHQKLDVETHYVSQIPFSINFRKAIEITGQAQFHPMRYIGGLAEVFEKKGGLLLTKRRVKKYEKLNDTISITTANGEVFTAGSLVWATHIPPGNNRFNILLAPYRSYALSAKIRFTPEKMAQAADLYDPYHYFRYHRKDENNYLIIGGFDHKTGQEKDTTRPFKDLENYARENFDIEEITHQWSSQFYVPVDGLPYIGKMPGEENMYVATGYNGNGMTWGTLASEIIADLIQRKDNELAEIVSPSRIEIQASATTAIQENVNAVFHLVTDRFMADSKAELDEIPKGEGKVIQYQGDQVAVYREDTGGFVFVSAICPHMGCTVQFNTAEKSWDCPCHGSRFDTDGNLMNMPATEGLQKCTPLNKS